MSKAFRDVDSITSEFIKEEIKRNDIKFIRLQFVDILGMEKNMSVPAEHIDKILDNEMMLDGSSKAEQGQEHLTLIGHVG